MQQRSSPSVSARPRDSGFVSSSWNGFACINDFSQQIF
jgi:hypothetical protein